MILFKGMLNSRIESTITIKNNSPTPICFKIKTSSPKDFLVTPTTAQVRPKDESSVLVTFTGPPESRNKGQKFLVQIAFASDSKLVDWKSKDVLEFKLGTKFMVMDSEEKPQSSSVEEKEELNKNPTVYRDIEFEEEVGVSKGEDEKKVIIGKNVELSGEIEKIKLEIEKAQYKLKHKKSLEGGKVVESVGKYSIPHVLLAFIIGLFAGFYVLG